MVRRVLENADRVAQLVAGGDAETDGGDVRGADPEPDHVSTHIERVEALGADAPEWRHQDKPPGGNVQFALLYHYDPATAGPVEVRSVVEFEV
ncbi:hypothetical protein GCM10009602_26090 [Nocardiopsis tropica]